MENITTEIAIIMSVYKNDKLLYIQQAVESILNQKNVNYLFFMHLDGKVNSVVMDYLNKLQHSNKIILSQSILNNGLSNSLNYLIDKVLIIPNIKYIARMDSDDISLPERLSKQVRFLENHPNIDVLGTACKEFGSSFSLEKKFLPSHHDDLVKYSICRCPFIHPTVMFRRKVFDDGNRYPTHTTFTEDMAFWLELIYKGYKLHNLPDVLLQYRLEDNTMHRRKGLSKAKSEFSLRMGYMFLLNQVSLKNILLISSRYIFHLLPPSIMSKAYKYLR
ncbi:glycosyltransferase [Proteus mirabilis]|uniref:glycosyltransferase n=1 Tax=Proteus mirabilis TaxID=584 RepID=UPI001B38551C|nr:glycosyltransferase [Proteus mirabilis]MBQ0654065.1 glycosyltransferase [Proteus mirabilis]